MIQYAWDWCTGMTWRDGTGMEVGGGFRMGNTCTPVADSCWCVAEPIQYCKVKKKKKERKEIHKSRNSIIIAMYIQSFQWSNQQQVPNCQMVKYRDILVKWQYLSMSCFPVTYLNLVLEQSYKFFKLLNSIRMDLFILSSYYTVSFYYWQPRIFNNA